LKVHRAGENVEGVRMVGVAVRIRSLVGGLELELDQAELVGSDLDRGNAVICAQRLPLTGLEENPSAREPIARPSGVDAVEATQLPAVDLPQVLRKPCIGSVEVEEPSRHR